METASVEINLLMIRFHCPLKGNILGQAFTWIRQCFNVSSTTSIPIDVINQDSFPSNHCDSLTTQGPDTTSRLSQRTTVVTRTSGSPGTDVTLRESTGTSTLSTRDGTRTVTNIPTTERTQDVTNVPTTEGTQAVTNIPTTDGTQAVTNVPTTEGTQAVTNVPTRQGTQDVTNIPTREGTQDVTNVKTTEGTQGVTTTTIGAQTTTTLTTTVGGQWGQTSIATVLSTESKIPGKESPSFLCVCNFKQPSSISIKEQLDARQEEIKKLSLNKSSLSSWRRKRESAKDNRVSAQTAGLIGVVCLAAVAFLIVLFDIGSLWIKISDKTFSITSK
ncbi:integumentary mucin A.1-like [Pomacea canaliculata]|uniref:integumentary mucin A.1-like n=1 Tax=Pomacea canaliculata TaxID=400727 RepID=UPI000D73B257|nr:integumentary mucin A.1-like [Pomacea canaliculata]